jgi:quercetin dioxygenase-like cupin family protein
MMQLSVIRWPGGQLPSTTDLRRQLEEDGYSTYQWRDEGGTDYGLHSHNHDECIWVVSGTLIFSVSGRELRLQEGDRLLLPKGTVHRARVPREPATYLIGELA